MGKYSTALKCYGGTSKEHTCLVQNALAVIISLLHSDVVAKVNIGLLHSFVCLQASG